MKDQSIEFKITYQAERRVGGEFEGLVECDWVELVFLL
jgi:hypothetical protein